MKTNTVLAKTSQTTYSFFTGLAFLIAAFATQNAHAKSADSYVNQLIQSAPSSLYVASNSGGGSLYQHNIDTPMVPASTMKVLTAYMALKRWGPYHQFHTDIMLDKEGFLWIKGYGDPYMVSEEMGLMANGIVSRLRSKGLNSVKGIVVDDSFFDLYGSQLDTKRSLNPYDAPLGATSVNFNSIGYRKYSGSISSTEDQTPLTSVSYEISELTGNGKHRISLRNANQSRRHYEELLAIKLQERGINIGYQRQSRRPSALPVYIVIIIHVHCKILL